MERMSRRKIHLSDEAMQIQSDLRCKPSALLLYIHKKHLY